MWCSSSFEPNLQAQHLFNCDLYLLFFKTSSSLDWVPMEWLNRTSHWKTDNKWPLKSSKSSCRRKWKMNAKRKYKQISRSRNVKCLKKSEQHILRRIRYILGHMKIRIEMIIQARLRENCQQSSNPSLEPLAEVINWKVF